VKFWRVFKMCTTTETSGSDSNWPDLYLSKQMKYTPLVKTTTKKLKSVLKHVITSDTYTKNLSKYTYLSWRVVGKMELVA